jgi:hypothetical protein
VKTMLHKDLLTDRTLKVRHSREAHFRCGQRAGATKSSLHLAASFVGHLNCLLMTLTSVWGHAQALWDIAAGRHDAEHPTNAQVGLCC